MPEMLSPGSALVGAGLGKTVPLITDGRFSGACMHTATACMLIAGVYPGMTSLCPACRCFPWYHDRSRGAWYVTPLPS